MKARDSRTLFHLDNVAGNDQKEHDANVQIFLEAIQHRNQIVNKSKSVESVTSINILGYCVDNGTIKADPKRLRPLQRFPPPLNSRSLHRIVGKFAYNAKWIPKFSDMIQARVGAVQFPLDKIALTAFDLFTRRSF